MSVAAGASNLFDALGAEDRARILQHASRRRVMRGERLIAQGDAADTLYYVLRGRFDVLRDGVHLVAEIGAGEPVGEIAFFGDLPRTADVIAARDSDILELSRPAWAALSQQFPEMTAAVLRNLSARLASATVNAPQLSPKIPGAIGLCAAGATPVPVALIEMLCAGFAAIGERIVVLRHSDLPVGFDVAAPGRLTDWLAERESEGRLWIVTGEGNPAWDHAALAHCDHLLLCGRLAEAQAGPVQPSAFEQSMRALFRPRQKSLLLWRENAAMPIIDSAAWLSGYSAHLHHHIALDSAGDGQRIARFLSGRALGAVFGGGGAFGAAHIGALRALYGAGVQFDLAGGTSIGSVIAMAVAARSTPAEMLEDFEQALARDKAMGRLALPRYGLLDSHHIDAVLRKIYGEQRIEDLPLNAFAVAANLSTNERQVQRSGLVWSAVRTSVSIPGALPPMISDAGEVLVDGGIMDNVPVAVMRELKLGPNCIFSLSADSEWRVKARYHDLPRRWQSLWQTLSRRGDVTDLPRIGEVITRSMQVASGRSFRGAGLQGDRLFALPELPGMNLLSFTKARQQEQLGYEFTCRMLEESGGEVWLSDWK